MIVTLRMTEMEISKFLHDAEKRAKKSRDEFEKAARRLAQGF
jgi:hypothetical protein